MADQAAKKPLTEAKAAPPAGRDWVAQQGLDAIGAVLAAEQPEIAVVMYGTNDVRKWVTPADYRRQLDGIVAVCLEAGCVPIVSTIPPMLNMDDRVAEFNAAVRTVAADRKIPLVDFSADNLRVCGYALRNHATLKVMQDVIEKCF